MLAALRVFGSDRNRAKAGLCVQHEDGSPVQSKALFYNENKHGVIPNNNSSFWVCPQRGAFGSATLCCGIKESLSLVEGHVRELSSKWI